MKQTFAVRTLAGGAPPMPSSASDPLGPISGSLENARNHLASCISYQAFLGVTGSEAAAAKTYLAALPAPNDGAEYSREEWENKLRNFGLISLAPAGGYRVERSALYATRESGRMSIELEATIPSDFQANPEGPVLDLTADLEAADRWINNQIGQIVAEFMGKSGQPGYLDASSMTVMMGPCRTQDEDVPTSGFYYWTILEVVWGAE